FLICHTSLLISILSLHDALPILSVPFGTPIVVAGFLHGSWTFALAQVLLIPICALIYYPFVKILDKKNLEQESSEVEVLGEMNRSEEHTSELQSRFDLVCRLLLE